MPKSRGRADWEIGESSADFSKDALFGVAGRAIVITGGGSGIGSMMAAGFVAQGARVYIVSRKDCSPLAAELTARGPGRCAALRGDVADDADIAALVAALDAQEPRGVHALINNAGTNFAAPIGEYPSAAWDKVYRVNTRGVFMLTQALLPALERSAAGPGGAGTDGRTLRACVVNIASIEALQTPAHPTFAYSTGKAAVRHLSRVLAGKFGMDGRRVNVNSICPGPFQSRMMRVTLETVGRETVAGVTACGRIGNPQDMAGAALYLCSPAGQYVTGASLTVDGGAVAMPHMAMSPLAGESKL